MKKIFTTGSIAVLSMGIILFLGKIVIYDFFASIFRPLILFLFHKESLVIPLTLVFLLLIILLLGVLFSGAKFRGFVEKTLKRFPKWMGEKRGVLLTFAPGAYYFAANIKEIKFKKADGSIEKRHVLYCPYSPFPWSGLPIVLAKEENVTLLNISYRELYSITASLGRNTPDVLEELSPFISTD